MEKIKKGAIIEIEVPNVEKPIKAVVLDVTEYDFMESVKVVSLLCYAQKRLFKVSCKYAYKIKLDENGTPYKDCEYRDYKYDDTIVGYCEIPTIPSCI